MKTEELEVILNNHEKWLNNDDNGVRADLSNVNLRNADLRNADLRNACLNNADLGGVSGNGKHVKSLQTDKYLVSYTTRVLQIGCKRFTIDEWRNFDDKTISKMDSGALEWWTKWKPIIMQILEMSPCEPTKEEDENDNR